MPTSPTDSVTSPSRTRSNKNLTAETVSDTVMAEQIGHNVVDNIESTSGSPLVDVAANQANPESAGYGTNDQDFLETRTSDPQPSQPVNDDATDFNAQTSSAIAGIQATDAGAEPSAGEAPGEAFETPASTPELTTADKSTIDAAQLVNGIHDPTATGDGSADDANVPEGSVDVSLNSDAEGSRGDASEIQRDEKHHTRTNSVKKPTTFSKVSVTKNFLAKSATPTPTVVKIGDKPSPVGTPLQNSAAKPRLIAKTGASLRDVQKARQGPEGSSGPDASKVWNKNRPVAPPPPRQFTDEELKQQYGIHLATRLQTDENGKESKWADIDDDEDDWAPETVVWMDGTKSTLTPQEAAAPMQKELKPVSPQPAKPAEGVKPTLALRKQTDLGPTKTILKPGSGAAAVQAKQDGSPAGTPTEKPSLKAKSPAPAPAKSPWASLPPVERVSPINPPVQAPQPPPFVSQDARAYEQPLPPQPAREIAADTFDRSWREGEGGTRELFNSANGRYEPVAEGRRGSIKPDSVRKPAVLQRPSQSSAAPAEPSPAFQTRSTSQMDGSWGRRRGSSVSQGSIPPVRRMSVSKGPEISPAPERRSSTVIGHDLRTSPRMARNEPAPPVFSQQSAWQQQMPPQPEPGTEEEDPVKVQERIMREKRELAKKRRQEEEERLEKEKQERLKARLAQLEGAGKSRKEREAEAAVASPTPTTEKPAETAVPSQEAEMRAQPTKPAEMASMAAPALESQTLPPAPEDPRAKQTSPEERLPSPLAPKQQPIPLPDRPISSADQNGRQPARPHLSPRANARAPFQQQASAYKAPTSSYSSSGDRKPQPFGRSPLPNTDAFSTPWPTTAPNGNVWGTSGIGNGTFESANGFAPMPMSQQNSALPPPPGMTRPSTSTRISPQALAQESRSPNLQQQTVAEPHRGFAPPGFEPRPDPFASQTRASGPSPGPAAGMTHRSHAPGPIAPPSRSQQQQPVRKHDTAAWTAAAERLPNEFMNDAEAAGKKKQDPSPSVPLDDTIKETWRRTTATQTRLGAPRKFEKTEYTVYDAQGSRSVQTLSPAPPNAQTQPSGPFSTASPVERDPWKQAGENTVRIPDGSLNPAHGGLPVHQPPIAPPSASHAPASSYQGNAKFPTTPLAPTLAVEDQSPPPPESSSHPVNSGDASHPLVRLPWTKPVVKLPPTPASAPMQLPMTPQNSAIMPQRPISNWGAPERGTPIVKQLEWQARFNGLLGRAPIQTETPPSPPKTPPKWQGPALAVASSTRTLMDEVPATTGATVSLPQAKKVASVLGFTIDDSDEVVSKPTIEQMFNEERSFGSLPKVTVPRNPLYEDKMYEPLPRDMLNTKFVSVLPVHSSLEFNMVEVHRNHPDGVFVSLPTVNLRKFVKDITGSHKPTGFHRDRKASSKFNSKGKGKESSPASPSSPVTNGAPNTGSRKTSVQNGKRAFHRPQPVKSA